MFARVLSGKVKPGMWHDYEQYYNEKVVPPTQKMKGFRERRLLRSLDSPDEGVSICVWETKEDLENYVRSIERQTIVREAEKFFASQYSVSDFEIRISAVHVGLF
jgi:heme-degrading monooxygenase HmoA